MRYLLTSMLLTGAALMAAPALAKLAPPSAEAKAKAAEAAAKTAWSDKVGSYQLCQAMNRVAANYRTTAKAAGKDAQAAIDTPACADPGAFVLVPVAAAVAPPLEAAGAHSPPKTATAPPSGKATAAELQRQPKK